MVKLFPFLPWMKQATPSTLKSDLLAGLTNAFVVLPQGVAFAMIAGLPPEYGLYTAMVPPVVAALFGSSFHLISGPTTAISIVVFSTISPYAEAGTGEFIALVLALTFLTGLIQLLLGLARLGVMVNFISHTVVIGFTAGAAILIATSQLKHCLGISIPNSGSFIQTWVNLYKGFPDMNPHTLSVALITLLTALMLKKWAPNIPGMLLAMITGSVIAFFLGAGEHNIRLLGPIDSFIPPLSMPVFSMMELKFLSSGAIAVAILGLIEAVSIARSVAIKSQQKIDGNQEFIGQGLSNIVGSFFSCYASSGSFTRSGINYAAGAKTPMAAIFAAGSLALILLLFADLVAYIPIAAMGGIILFVAYNLIDFYHIKAILRTSKSESVILITTFTSTLIVKLEFAIYVGIIMSLIFYLKETSHPKIVSRVPNPSDPKRPFSTDTGLTKCPELEIIRIDGSIYFGSTDHVGSALRRVGDREPGKRHLLIICSGINFIDIAGAEMLKNEAERYKKNGGNIYLCKVKSRIYSTLEKGGYLDAIGKENVFHSKDEAIRTIHGRLDKSSCSECKKDVFLECDTKPD